MVVGSFTRFSILKMDFGYCRLYCNGATKRKIIKEINNHLKHTEMNNQKSITCSQINLITQKKEKQIYRGDQRHNAHNKRFSN